LISAFKPTRGRLKEGEYRLTERGWYAFKTEMKNRDAIPKTNKVPEVIPGKGRVVQRDGIRGKLVIG